MVIRTKDLKYSFWLILLLVVTIIPLIIGDITLNFKLYVHDFTKPDILRRFSYHLTLMLQPTILSWIIFTFAKGFWKAVSIICFLWFLKDCIDVIIHNNRANTLIFDLVALLFVIIIIMLWEQLKKKI